MEDLALIWKIAKETGAGMNAAILMVAVFNGVRVSRVERQMAAVVAHVGACPVAKKSRLTMPLALLIALFALMMLNGCVAGSGRPAVGFNIELGLTVPPAPSHVTNQAPAAITNRALAL